MFYKKMKLIISLMVIKRKKKSKQQNTMYFRKMKNKKFIILAAAVIVLAISFYAGQHSHKADRFDADGTKINIAVVGKRVTLKKENKWKRSLIASDGTIYFRDSIKSTDGGKTFIRQNEINIDPIIDQPERAVLSTKETFFALDGPTKITAPGVFSVRCWRSTDNLKSVQEEKAIMNVPEGPKIHFDDQWNGIYVYRTILKMPDGSWLATMYGNFATDTLTPQNKDAAMECKFMMRTFIITSTDKGRTWNYLSTVAIPHEGDPVGEGFVEPAITLLHDGRLLCVMRSGHHFPLYSSWSSDGGKTWTDPLYTGFDRGCDPCLITLHDGRVALSWGRRFPEGWSQVTQEGDKGRFVYPGEGYNNLSISDDGGKTWETTKIDNKTGSCYSTIFEIEPNVIFCQVDRWCWRIKLRQKG